VLKLRADLCCEFSSSWHHLHQIVDIDVVVVVIVVVVVVVVIVIVVVVIHGDADDCVHSCP
jgi:hypothetical protein